jgi:hypothetical protein
MVGRCNSSDRQATISLGDRPHEPSSSQDGHGVKAGRWTNALIDSKAAFTVDGFDWKSTSSNSPGSN